MKTLACTLSLALAAAAPAPVSAQSTAAAAPAPDAPIPVEAFAALPVMENPQLSPDGSRIVAKMAVNGAQRLVVIPLHATDGKPAVLGVGESVDVNWWRWVGPKWIAVGVGAQSALYGTEIYVTRTVGVDAALTRVNRIDWPGSGVRADDLVWAARDGTPRVLLARQTGIDSIEQFYPEVIEVDLSNGKTRRIVPGRIGVFDWFADGAGQVRMGYRYDDTTRKGELLYRANNAAPFRTIATRKRDDERGIPLPLVFRADGTAIATDDSAGYDAVYEVSLPDLTLGKRVFGADGYDVTPWCRTPRRTIWPASLSPRNTAASPGSIPRSSRSRRRPTRRWASAAHGSSFVERRSHAIADRGRRAVAGGRDLLLEHRGRSHAAAGMDQ